MTKELDALKEIGNYRISEIDYCVKDTSEYDIIETALKNYEEYKKVFEKLNLDISDAVDLENWIKLAQFHYENKNKKITAFKLIKEKDVAITLIKTCENLYQYNLVCPDKEKLTQEEFDLLKEVLL